VPTRWPTTAATFHPTLPVVTIGTGSYDGGYLYEGELLFLDLVTGSVVSLLERPREVRKIVWRDEQTLDLVLAVPTDEHEERLGTASVACSIGGVGGTRSPGRPGSRRAGRRGPGMLVAGLGRGRVAATG